MSELVKFKHGLKQHSKIFGTISSIVNKVKEIENYIALKVSPDLVEYVCNCVENEMGETPADKKQMVMEIFSSLFDDLSEEYKTMLSNWIDNLSNNKRIQKVSVLKKTTHLLKSYVLPKAS